MNATLSIQDLIKMAEESSSNYIVNSVSSKFSVGIVNSTNGKRLSFSKSLCKALDLSGAVYILTVPEEGKMLVSNAPLSSKASKGLLSRADKKICYSAQLVNMVSCCFDLDFTSRTSMSFTDIDFDDVNDIKVAIVTVKYAEVQDEETV